MTVPDLDQATAFFTDVLGAEAFYPLGPYGDDGTDATAISFGVHPRATVTGMRLLRFRNLNIELFEWDSPDQIRSIPRLTDHGACEVCLYVDDMDEAMTYLREHGVEPMGEKLDLDGPEAGPEATFWYFRTPWGALMELISYPQGRAYEVEYERFLWNPGKVRIEE